MNRQRATFIKLSQNLILESCRDPKFLSGPFKAYRVPIQSLVRGIDAAGKKTGGGCGRCKKNKLKRIADNLRRQLYNYVVGHIDKRKSDKAMINFLKDYFEADKIVYIYKHNKEAEL
jgi:hypothetical protein